MTFNLQCSSNGRWMVMIIKILVMTFILSHCIYRHDGHNYKQLGNIRKVIPLDNIIKVMTLISIDSGVSFWLSPLSHLSAPSSPGSVHQP